MGSGFPEPRDFTPVREDWKSGPGPNGIGKRRRYPMMRAPVDGQSRPIVFTRIAATANHQHPQVFPGLIDTGAPVSLAPRWMCDALGVPFESGTPVAPASGIGGMGGRSFSHQCHFSILRSPLPDPEVEAVFGPFYAPLVFLEEDIPYLLLGQADLLSRFAYTQVPREGWFELEWLIKDAGGGRPAPRTAMDE